MGQVLAANIDLDIGAMPLDQRAQARRCLSLQVAGSVEAQQDFNATVRDLSRFGFLIESMSTMTTGEMIFVEFPRMGRVSAQVAWTENRMAGCRFLQPISSGALSAALLRAVPEAAPLTVASPFVRMEPGTGDELSLRQKLLVLMGLSLTAWLAVLGGGYAGLRLLNG
jgi:hypothetical protein